MNTKDNDECSVISDELKTTQHLAFIRYHSVKPPGSRRLSDE